MYCIVCVMHNERACAMSGKHIKLTTAFAPQTKSQSITTPGTGRHGRLVGRCKRLDRHIVFVSEGGLFGFVDSTETCSENGRLEEIYL